MRTVLSEDHRRQNGRNELIEGQFVPVNEMPRRAEIVIERVRAQKLGEILPAQDFGLDPILKVHDQGLVNFLQSAWAEWSATGRTFDALPHVWPVPGLGRKLSDSIDGKLGYYAMPLLWREHVIGWGNLSVTAGVLDAQLQYVAGRPPKDAAFGIALEAELARMRAFLGLEG